MLFNMASSRAGLIKLLLLLGALIMLFGCREYRLYHYEEIRDSLFDGDIAIDVVASRQLSEENGKRIAIESNPYSLLVKYSSSEKFKKIEVNELTLTAVDSRNVISLSKSASKDASILPNTDKYFGIVSFSSQLKNKEIKHEAYELKALLLIYKMDGSARKIHINYQLKPTYKTEKRSDIVDGIMGI